MSKDIVSSVSVNEAINIPKDLQAWREHLASPFGDEAAFNHVIGLRQEVESQAGWIATKELAKKELAGVSENIFESAFDRLNPYLDALPVGHSKKHISRNFIESAILLNDPWVKDLDDVEKFVGVMAGAFHDVGSSVVGRYDEAKRFAGHAEAGAYLFGKVTEDLLPPNLSKLIQFAIAAHTHYTKDIQIKKVVNGQEKSVIKSPYDDKMDKERNKAGVWLTRWSDRVDAQGIQFVIRHILTKAEPTQDYDQEGFHVIQDDEKADFIYHLTPGMRKSDFTNGRNALEHIAMFRQSALSESVYSRNDSPFFKENIIRPNTLEQEKFVDEVLKDPQDMPDEQRDHAFDIFYKACRDIDGGSGIDNALDLLRIKFAFLEKQDLQRWARGFMLLPELIDSRYLRVERQLKEQEGLDINVLFRNVNLLAQKKHEELKISIAP